MFNKRFKVDVSSVWIWLFSWPQMLLAAFQTHWQLAALSPSDRGIPVAGATLEALVAPIGQKWPLHCEKMRNGIYGMSTRGHVFEHVSTRVCRFFEHAHARRNKKRVTPSAKKRAQCLICLIAESWLAVLNNLDCKFLYLHDLHLAIHILPPTFSNRLYLSVSSACPSFIPGFNFCRLKLHNRR